MRIRSSTNADIDALCVLYYEFHEFHVQGVPHFLRSLGPLEDQDWATLRQALVDLMARQAAALLVAETDGKIVGLAEVYVPEPDTVNTAVVARRYAHLQSLLVTATQRGTGLGRRLVEAAQAWARQQGATEMRLDTWEFAAGPLHFYERLGYRTIKCTLAMDLSRDGV